MERKINQHGLSDKRLGGHGPETPRVDACDRIVPGHKISRFKMVMNAFDQWQPAPGIRGRKTLSVYDHDVVFLHGKRQEPVLENEDLVSAPKGRCHGAALDHEGPKEKKPGACRHHKCGQKR